MAEENNNITFFAETNFRNKRSRFGIKRNDRRKHMYVIGKTGMGKTTLLENMAIQDIQNGEGIAIVDPHGEFAEKMLQFVPESRKQDVIYFNPADMAFPVAFNTLENVSIEQRHLVASGLLGVFKKIWPDVWSARMEYLLSNAILALLETPNATLLGINRMFADKVFRKDVVSKLTDPVVRAFWEKEYASYQDKFASEASAAIQNKVGQFTSNPLIRNIIGQTNSSIDMRKIMDEQKIFIMNLSKGKIGEENSRLLGAMLVTKLYLTAMSRVDIPEAERKDFFLYVDEFQNFATDSFASILSEARKYRLDLILAHQYVMQMEEKTVDAVFGNVGTTISFRIGAQDAELLEKEFAPDFMVQDFVNLSFAQIYLKLMIDGVSSRPFSASTLAPMPPPEQSFEKEIIEFSRTHYGSAQADIEEKIMAFHGLSATGTALPGTAVIEEKGERKDKPVRELFDAHCIVDGEVIKVPFKPDGRRPVYCEKHLEMFKAGTLPEPERPTLAKVAIVSNSANVSDVTNAPQVLRAVEPRVSVERSRTNEQRFGRTERRFERPRQDVPRERELPQHENRFGQRRQGTDSRFSYGAVPERSVRNEIPAQENAGQYRPMIRREQVVRTDRNSPRVSLGELKPRPAPPVGGFGRQREIPKEKKEVDSSALREVLEKSLEGVRKDESFSDKKENVHVVKKPIPNVLEEKFGRASQKESGVMKPGDTIRFD